MIKINMIPLYMDPTKLVVNLPLPHLRVYELSDIECLLEL